ncbi:MAG: hypothetical protein IIA40_12180 [SAR324 cluster bacterium]|nr:hypothetical protein [SAR324 cluster bacterium]
MGEIQFDEVPKHYKTFVMFDVNGEEIGWSKNETDWQAVADWNNTMEQIITENRSVATSAVEISQVDYE